MPKVCTYATRFLAWWGICLYLLQLGARRSLFDRGDIPNMLLALKYESRLRGCFAWNHFRHRVEVIRKTPWCLPEWWEAAGLTPVGYREIRDADIAEFGTYLTQVYDFGACAMQASRVAIHTAAITTASMD